MTAIFQEWPKIPRWENESYVITEKIDGTNGCIIITDAGDVYAQSRSRILDETKLGDNYGFCKWVYGNKNDLLRLGVGYHYGEWWGLGINRGYGLSEKRFSLFNIWLNDAPECVHKVPIVADRLILALERLADVGSIAAPGFKKPEGLILQARCHNSVRYKFILD